MRKNKSAIKKAKQSEERRVRNAHVKSGMKTQIKKALAAIEANDKENSGEFLKSAISSINNAASKKVIHKNNAARKCPDFQKRQTSSFRQKDNVKTL